MIQTGGEERVAGGRERQRDKKNESGTGKAGDILLR